MKSAFAREILCKNCNDVESRKLELIKTSLKALITNMLYIKAWNRVLTLVSSVFISIISICLVKACFWIFFYTFIAFKIMFDITLGYIVICKETLKRSIFDRKLFLELMLFLAFCKQYWIYIRLVYLRYSVILVDLYL